MGRKTKLTPDVQTKIVAYVRAGAYDWVAAQACGIGSRTFFRWMELGEKGNPTYRQFWQEVCGAHAQARITAEMAVIKENPFNWLRYGPGREKPGQPGWTESHAITDGNGEPVAVNIYIPDNGRNGH